MFTRIFGKSKQEENAVATLDKLNEVSCIFVVELFVIIAVFIVFLSGFYLNLAL